MFITVLMMTKKEEGARSSLHGTKYLEKKRYVAHKYGKWEGEKRRMKRREMKKRLAKGEDPLALSIEKWEDIIKTLEKRVFPRLRLYLKRAEQGRKNCALCEMYPACAACPVARKVRRFGCWGTPYHSWRFAGEHRGDLGLMRKIAKEELEFLKLLRRQREENE